MSEVKILGEFYFSQILNTPIKDAQGRRVGQVKDMAMRWDSLAPHVTGIKFAKGVQDLIPIERVASMDRNEVRLSVAFSPDITDQLQEDETFIGKWLLDKQIIDLKGSKLVRVNDLTLSWITQNDRQLMVLVAVDIGVRGLFRRLGAEFLVSKIENNFLGWQYMKPLESRTSALQITREKEQMRELHPADIADLLETMGYKERADLIHTMDSQQAIEALSEMELEAQVEVINQLDEYTASDLLEEMPPDEAADILGELSVEKSEELLSLMESDDAEDVRELMKYEEDTAGALMTTEYIGLPLYLTAEEAINKLRELAPDAETIYYLFVVDEEDTLEGVLSLRELIIAPPSTQLKALMHRKVVNVHPLDDTEKVADIINKYGLLAVPVVDEANKMLGIITVDDVLELLIPERGKSELDSWLVVRKRQAKRGQAE